MTKGSKTKSHPERRQEAVRRHTSFASVEVTPEISDDVNIVIEEKEFKKTPNLQLNLRE